MVEILRTEYERAHNYEITEERDLARGSCYWVVGGHMTPPGYPRTPMYDWMHCLNCSAGFRYAAEKLSLPYCRGNEVPSYRGYILIRSPLTPPEEQERKLAKFREALRPLMENFDVIWDEARSELMGYWEKFKRFDYEAASWYELFLIFEEYVRAFRRQWEHHMYIMEGMGSIFILFEDLCKELLGIDDTDPLFMRLVTGFDSKAYEMDRGLWQLGQRAEQLGLRDSVLASKPQEVIPALERTEAGRQWIKELRDWLEEYGWRIAVQVQEFHFPTWIEDPTPAIERIQIHLKKAGAYEKDELTVRQEKERKAAEEEVLSRLPVEQREWFKTLLTLAQKAGWWFEEHDFYCEDYMSAIGRYVLLRIGERLSRVGCIEKPDDVLYLVGYEEMLHALIDPENYDFKPTVRRRRAQWEENKKVMLPPFIAKVSPPEVMELLVRSRDPAIVKIAAGRMAVPKPELKADLMGLSGSPGVAEGPARVIFAPEQMGEVQVGDILVCPATNPNWMPAFSLVKAIITDVGGSMAHASIVGREYGIPVVVNTLHGTSTIKSGQRLKVDATLGAIWILD